MNNTFTFCPMCQLPLKAINILPDVHVGQCMSIINEDSPFNVSECPNGIHCLSTDLFHYRDFSHKLLAAYRSSAAYVPPDVDIQPTPKKKKITPRRSSRKQKTPVKLNIKNNSAIESDSDGEIFIPLKPPCRKLSFNENSDVMESTYDESKSIHKAKILPLEESGISTDTKDSEAVKKTDDDCDIIIIESDCITDNNCTDTKSNQVKYNTLNTSKSTNLTLDSTNDKLSEIKLNCVEETSGLSKEPVQKDPDKHISEVIFDQDKNKLEPKKNLDRNQTINAQNELENECLDKKSSKNMEKLRPNQPIHISKPNSEEKCVEQMYIDSTERPELDQTIYLQTSSSKKLSRTLPSQLKKHAECEKITNAQDDSEDEFFDTKSITKKSLKRSQTTDSKIKDDSKLKKNLKEKCPETRSSPRVKNQKLAQQNNIARELSRRVPGQAKKGLELNQAVSAQGVLEDEHSDTESHQVKKKFKLDHPIDESKLSPNDKCSETSSNQQNKHLELDQIIDIQKSTDDIFPRRMPGRPKKKLDHSQTINAQIDSKGESLDSNSNQAMKKLKTSQATDVYKNSPVICAATRYSQRKRDQELNQQNNLQKSSDKKMSRRMPIRLRKEFEINQAIDAHSDLKVGYSGTKSDKVADKLCQVNQHIDDGKTDLDEKCSEKRTSQMKKDQEPAHEINAQTRPDKKVSKRMPGRPKKTLENNQAIDAQSDLKNKYSGTKSDKVTDKLCQVIQEIDDAKKYFDEKCSETRSSQGKKDQEPAQEINTQRMPDKKVSKRMPGRPKKNLENNQVIDAQRDSEDECSGTKSGKVKEKLCQLNQQIVGAKIDDDEQFSKTSCSQPKKNIKNNQQKINKICDDKLLKKKPGRPKKKIEYECNKSNDIQDECFKENHKLNQVQGSSCVNLSETIPIQVNKQLNPNQVRKTSLHDKQFSEKNGYDEKYIATEVNKEKENIVNNPINNQLEVITSDENCNTEQFVMGSPHQSPKNRRNLLITDVDLNSEESCAIMNTEVYSSALDNITDNNINSSKQDEIATANNNTNLAEERVSFTSSKHSTYLNASKDSQVLLKPIRCVIERLELSDKQLEYSQSANKNTEQENKKNVNDLDFDDIIPGARLDKDLLRNLERNESNSPTTSLHTYISDYNASASGSFSSSDVENEIGLNTDDAPSSPETIQPSIKKHKNRFISSSSDSDMPLASLPQNKRSDKSKENNINQRNNTAKELRSLKTPQVYNNCQFLSGSEISADSDVDSGKSTASKNSSTISVLKGKEVAGKILRTPKNIPASLEDKSTKSNSDGKSAAHSDKDCTDKDSDSGKSSGSKDLSFIPSERDSSTHPSDSAFSAESSDNLISSSSSTYISSEDFSSDNKSSDPSYSTDSENLKLISKYRSHKSNRISPKKYERSSQSLSGESSDISQKEKTLFRRKVKSSPVKLETNSQQDKPNGDLYNIYEHPAKKEWQSVLSKMRSNCFPSDLKIDSEDSLTVASSCSSSDTSRSSMTLPLRQCPFYKRIPDTPFAVDAFQYWNIPGVRAYFLSHFHSDHYIGLKKSFAKPIYCSRITANLVRMQLRVEEKWLRILELNEPQAICGVEVTALDANHCPGSMMFLFSLSNGQNYLHVGDFRGCKAMTKYPALQRITIAKLYLDTTYCSPQYCFPTQEEVIRKVIDIVREQVKTKPRTLVVCGSYTIGKEKVFLGVAEALGWRVWARPNKQRVFACLNDTRINSRLCQDPRNANVHVLPMASIQIMPLQQHLQSCSSAFTHVLGFKPTGWELSGKSENFKVTSRDNITIYGVPYSEHSSFTELRDFVQFLEPREVVPTVNVGSTASRNKMSKYFSEWMRPQTSSSQPTKSQSKISQFFK